MNPSGIGDDKVVRIADVISRRCRAGLMLSAIMAGMAIADEPSAREVIPAKATSSTTKSSRLATPS